MLSLVLTSVRTRLGQYLGVLLVSAMSAGLLTLLASVLDSVHHADPGHRAERSAQSLLGLVGGTSGFAALLLVSNTLALVAQQRRTEIGALRVIGATTTQIRIQIVSEAAVVAALGGVAGAAGGTLTLGPVLDWLINHHVLPTGPQPDFSPLGFAVGLLSTIVIAIPAALAAVRGPLRTSAVDALREAAVERRTLPVGRAIAATVALLLAWAVWDRYARKSGAHEALNGALALCMMLLIATWLLLPLVVRPVAALSSLPGRLLSRCTGRLAAANSASAGRRVAAMAGPVLLASGLSTMLLCGNAVSRATATAHNALQQENNAVGMRILMTPLIVCAALGILNTLLLATRQRRGEFAALRLAGSTRAQLLRMLGWESVVVVLSGLLAAGLVIGVFLAGLSTRIVPYLAELPAVLPWADMAKVAAGCAGLGVLGVLVPGVLVLRVNAVHAVE
ncbi:ABC transporter permease [Streptomyces sp. GS7]|uniref:ABC transporter permease n=1 Tax=Streptomyces sp. GS7 TaxID=2692234 RepID=UPI0013161281|nr:ABC transporter permease [Streptomyces sp. GS7]QHC21364.1 FtsX-like permease family protein [Streptomyces sp. GS7]